MRMYLSSFFLVVTIFIFSVNCSRPGTQEDLLNSADGSKNTSPIIINTPTATPLPTATPTMSPEKLGQNPQTADTVLVHYTGTLENGEQFDFPVLLSSFHSLQNLYDHKRMQWTHNGDCLP